MFATILKTPNGTLGVRQVPWLRHFLCFITRANMARRRKESDLVWLAAQAAGLVVLLVFVSPGLRKTLASVGFATVFPVGVALLGLVAFIVYRLATKLRRSSRSPFSAGHAVSIPSVGVTPRIGVDLHNGAVKVSPAVSSKLPGKHSLVPRLRAIDWFQFEKIVALAYQKHGYTISRRGGAHPDGGIDLTIRKDGETKAVQCKHWKTWKVGVKDVREFLGALTDAGISKGVFISLRGSTYAAQALASKHGIEMLNEAALATLLEKVDARFDPQMLAILEDQRKYCPRCEQEMVLRPARQGPNAGQKFWGCSTYPRCHFTMPASA